MTGALCVSVARTRLHQSERHTAESGKKKISSCHGEKGNPAPTQAQATLSTRISSESGRWRGQGPSCLSFPAASIDTSAQCPVRMPTTARSRPDGTCLRPAMKLAFVASPFFFPFTSCSTIVSETREPTLTRAPVPAARSTTCVCTRCRSRPRSNRKESCSQSACMLTAKRACPPRAFCLPLPPTCACDPWRASKLQMPAVAP